MKEEVKATKMKGEGEGEWKKRGEEERMKESEECVR